MEFIALIGSIALIYMLYRYNNPREDSHDDYDHRPTQSHYTESKKPYNGTHTVNHVVTQIAPEDRKAGKGYRGMYCPQCRSLDVSYMNANGSSGFSFKKAIVGGILTAPIGGIGAAAGLKGKKGKRSNWHCRSCGNVFKMKNK